jgi:hypothetical protein
MTINMQNYGYGVQQVRYMLQTCSVQGFLFRLPHWEMKTTNRQPNNNRDLFSGLLGIMNKKQINKHTCIQSPSRNPQPKPKPQPETKIPTKTLTPNKNPEAQFHPKSEPRTKSLTDTLTTNQNPNQSLNSKPKFQPQTNA